AGIARPVFLAEHGKPFRTVFGQIKAQLDRRPLRPEQRPNLSPRTLAREGPYAVARFRAVDLQLQEHPTICRASFSQLDPPAPATDLDQDNVFEINVVQRRQVLP